MVLRTVYRILHRRSVTKSPVRGGRRVRDQKADSLKLVVPEFGRITYIGNAGVNNEDVICEAPASRPRTTRSGKIGPFLVFSRGKAYTPIRYDLYRFTGEGERI